MTQFPHRRWVVLVILGIAVAGLGCGESREPAGKPGAPENARPNPVEAVPADAHHRPLVLVVVDTVRADHLRIYGYDRDTMPELERWAKRGAVFERAIASSSWTLPSFASIYTGQHPGRHGAGRHIQEPGKSLSITGIAQGVPTLAEHLRAAGYATAAFVNNPFLSRQFGVARGFDRYSYVHADNQDIRGAAETVDLAIEWIEAQQGRAFFVMVHLFDPHMDYAPPSDVAGRFTSGYAGELRHPVTDGKSIRLGRTPLDYRDRAFIRGAYDEELFATDRELGRLLAALDARGLMDDGVVIVTSDHGEELFDHGNFEHGHTAYQELLHVPLVIWGPKVAPARHRAPVSHVDLFSTALDLAGRPIPEGVSGVTLRPILEGETQLPDRAIVADRTLHTYRHRVLIRWPWKAVAIEGVEKQMLFDLESDPLELNDLADRDPERLRAMLEELATLSPDDAGSNDRDAEVLDAAIRDQLESLGYVAPE